MYEILELLILWTAGGILGLAGYLICKKIKRKIK